MLSYLNFLWPSKNSSSDCCQAASWLTSAAMTRHVTRGHCDPSAHSSFAAYGALLLPLLLLSYFPPAQKMAKPLLRVPKQSYAHALGGGRKPECRTQRRSQISTVDLKPTEEKFAA